MANSDTAYLQSSPPNPLVDIHKELRIIAMLLREGFNLKDEDSSLSEQSVPTTPPTSPTTSTP
jgi:hypothetical protein